MRKSSPGLNRAPSIRIAASSSRTTPGESRGDENRKIAESNRCDRLRRNIGSPANIGHKRVILNRNGEGDFKIRRKNARSRNIAGTVRRFDPTNQQSIINYGTYRPISRLALWPPKPKLFDITRSTRVSRATWGMKSRSHSSSGSSRLIVGGKTLV